MIQGVADQDELDVGGLSGGLEAPVSRGLHVCLVAQRPERSGELTAPVRVAVDDHGPGQTLRRQEPRQGGDHPAGAGERLRRGHIHESLGGCELGAGAGRREGIDQGMRPAVAGEQPAIGDLAQGTGSRGRQLVLAIGNRRAQDLGQDGRARLDGLGICCLIAAGKALKPTRLIASSMARLVRAVWASRS